MSVQPKTIGSGLTLSSVRTQTDMLEAWLETLPTPSMIEARYRAGTPTAWQKFTAEREVWTLFRIEEDSNGKRVYRATDSSDSPAAAASHPDADLTTIGRVAVTLQRAVSVTVLVPETEREPETPEPDVSTATRRKELRAIVHDWAVNGTTIFFPVEDQVTLVEHLLGAKS